MIKVRLIESEEEQKIANHIREVVFVVEQNVAPELEYDEFENISRHFIAWDDEKGQFCGTARWRFTEKGIKLERFAVLKEYRSQGVGSALVRQVLSDIAKNPDSEGKKIYLHAQITAMALYQKFGFVQEGEVFYEADIAHYKMAL